MVKEKLLTLKPDVIEERFVFEDREFAVINNDCIGIDEGYALGEIVLEGEELLLKSVSDEDYKKVLEYYLELVELFS